MITCFVPTGKMRIKCLNVGVPNGPEKLQMEVRTDNGAVWLDVPRVYVNGDEFEKRENNE